MRGESEEEKKIGEGGRKRREGTAPLTQIPRSAPVC